MVGLVDTMRAADSLRPTAYSQDENEMRIAKDLPKDKTPHEWADSSRLTAAGFQFTACFRCQNLRHLRHLRNLRLLSSSHGDPGSSTLPA
jgi:hypothetical protein